MQKSLHVYVCSTYRDLVSERNAVVDGLEDLSFQFPALTFFCPRSIQTLDACKDEIGRSDLLILIVGHLQGVIAPGLDISHGEAEYNEGIAQGKPVLVYFRDEKVGLFPVHFERDAARAVRLRTFKEKLEGQHAPKIFSDLHSLVALVSEDVSRLARENGMEINSGPRNPRYKGKASTVTRKIPMVTGVTLIPEPSGDHQTRTIPIFQKALATPFRRRKSGTGRMGRTVILAMMLIVVAGVSLSKFHKLPLSSGAHFSLGNTAHGNLPEGGAVAGNPGADAQGEDPAAAPAVPGPAGIPAVAMAAPPAPAAAAPAPRPKPSATVVLMDDGDSTKAFLRKATDGSPADQFQVGEMYEQGKDVPRSDSLALRWYKKAAEKGFPEAQYKVATMYRNGKGTPRSSFQAARWFQAAAEQGNPKAQVKLGQMYQAGKGVQKSETTAFKWFLKAADQKDPEAERILAALKGN